MPPRGFAPWWGPGKAPHLRWPGSFIEIPAVWSKARGRWETPDGRYYFDVAAADKACDFFPTFCSHHIGEFDGQAFELLDWQRASVRGVFGWMHSQGKLAGLRRFRRYLGFVPKKNGKSPYGSALGLYLMLCDGEAGAEVYALAGDKDQQARIVHDTAKMMVEQSADLSELCEIVKDSILCPTKRSFFRVISSVAQTKHGARPHGIILDELHVQPSRDLLDALERSTIVRRQPLTVMLSHAGNDDESVCHDEYERGKNVISGITKDETFFPVIFEATPEDDWRSPTTWRKANPAYGITIREDAFEALVEAAHNNPKELNALLMYNLNRWVNQAVAWIPIDDWDACTDAPSYEPGLLTAAGLDMAQKIDLAAFAVTVRHPRPSGPALELEIAGGNEEQPTAVQAPHQSERTEQLKIAINFAMSIFVHFWVPEETMRERERNDRVPYSLWAKQGLVTPTPGVLIDEDRILADVRDKLVPRFALKARRCGYDPAFVSTSLLNGLTGAGLQMVETKQNYQMMNVPCQALYGLIKARWLRHGTSTLSHPLRWCAENVAIRQDDAGRIRPVKPKSYRKRIDGIVAGVMALDQLLRDPPGTGTDVYNERAKRGEPLIRTLEVRR